MPRPASGKDVLESARRSLLKARTVSELRQAPAAYIMVYTAGVCLFVPGTLLTALGAAISARIGALFTSGLVR